jgi:hypothetical protein
MLDAVLAKKKAVWKITCNVESFFRVVYTYLHPFFRRRLCALDGEDVDRVRRVWEQEQARMGSWWLRMISSSASAAFHATEERGQLEICATALVTFCRELGSVLPASASSASSARKRKGPYLSCIAAARNENLRIF